MTRNGDGILCRPYSQVLMTKRGKTGPKRTTPNQAQRKSPDWRGQDPNLELEKSRYADPIASRELLLKHLSEAPEPLTAARLAKRLGMNACPDAVDYLFERYYEKGRCTRASDCRDLLEIVQSICRFRRQPVHLTRELMMESSKSFISEF